MSAQLKTTTLFFAENPDTILCPGFVTSKEFNAAHRRECSGGTAYRAQELRYEFWTRRKNGAYHKSSKDNPRAKPYTVAGWDHV